MSRIFLLFLLASLVCLSMGCGKKRKKAGQNAKCSGGAIPCLLGKDVQSNPYTGNDSPGDCSQLKCDLDASQSCCWSNNQNNQVNWAQGSGATDPKLIKTNFATDTVPSGNFFVASSDTGDGTTSQTAQLYACSINCANNDITVRLKHWASKGTKIQVCQEQDPSSSPSNCQDLPLSNGQQDSVTIPKGQNVRVVIQAVGFTEKTGTAAMVDDIDVQCDPCPDTTTTAGPTQAPVTQAPAANPPCKAIVCNFESGNPCSYTAASGGGSASQNWGTQQAPYQNRLTGIPKPGEQQKFGACYLKKAGEKSTLQTDANFDQDYVVRFNYYKAVEGVNLKACCQDESNCPYGATPSVQTSDYRSWKTASILCKSGTNKVLFVSENVKGASEGAVGLDNIQLLQATGGSPDDASTSACTGTS